MIYLLYGQDDFSLSIELEGIKQALGDKELLALNTTLLEGKDVSLDQLRGSCETAPFLSQHRLVVIKGLLERFEDGARGQKADLSREEPKPILSIGDYILHHIPTTTVLVLISGVVKDTNPFLQQLAAVATIKKFPLKRGKYLHSWIREQVKQGKGSISYQAAQRLAQVVGENLWSQETEIQKLLLYASGRQIELEDVEKVVSHLREAKVFNLMDALMAQHQSEALLLLHRILPETKPSSILTLLARQVRVTILAKALLHQKVPKAEIQTRLGISSSYALDKTFSHASRYSSERLEETYARLLETDLVIKQGKYSEEVALDTLVGELSGSQETPGNAAAIHRPRQRWSNR